MNCQDIARILDEQEVDGLLAAEHSDVLAHLATCRECARDWQVHARLSQVGIPAVPAELRALYASQVAGVAGASAGRRSRFIVIGTLVAVAAAASMLAVQLTGSARPGEAIVDTAQEEAAAEPVASQEIPAEVHVEEIAQPATKSEQASVVTSTNPAQLKIVLMPTRYDSTDKAANPAIDAFQSSLLQALRNIPDVIVEVAGNAASAEDRPANRVTVVSPRFTTLSSGDRVYHSGGGEYTWSESGSIRNPRGLRFVEVVLQPAIQNKPYSNSGLYQYIDSNGIPTGGTCGGQGAAIDVRSTSLANGARPGDSTAAWSCPPSPEVLAARLIAALRPQAAPSASDTVQFISRLADASAPVRDREAAFLELRERARRDALVLDASAIEAITAYIGSLPAEQRASSLLLLRLVRQPGLVVPLLASLQQDGDEKVRLQALSVLAREYTSDSRVRTALETVARQDASRLVRMVAQRTLSGDAQWEPYVVATLMDKSLSTPERLAPAQYEAGLANFPEGFEKMQSYLGSAEVTRQLLDIIQELRDQARQSEAGGVPGRGAFQGFRGGQQPQDQEIQSVTGLLSITNPSAAIDVWIRILTEDPQSRSGLAVTALNKLMEKPDDPRVRKLIDDIAAGKAGPELRDRLERYKASRPWVAQPPPP